MASVNDTTAGVNLNDVIKSSGVKTTNQTGVASATNSSTGGQTLGREAFLKLLGPCL